MKKSNVTLLPGAKRNLAESPTPIIRPCEWGLISAITNMETQVGSIEAYNMLVKYAKTLKEKIDSGKGAHQNPLYRDDTMEV